MKKSIVITIILMFTLSLLVACNQSKTNIHSNHKGIESPIDVNFTPADFINIKNATVSSNLRDNVIVKFSVEENTSHFVNIFHDKMGNISTTLYYTFNENSGYLKEDDTFIEIEESDIPLYYTSLESLSGLIYTDIDINFITPTEYENIYEINPREFYKQVYKKEYSSHLREEFNQEDFELSFEENSSRYGNFEDYIITLTCGSEDIVLNINKNSDFTYIFKFYDINKTDIQIES